MLILRFCPNLPEVIFVLYVYLLFLDTVIADYCEFGICENDEYCCGYNICCKNSPAVWYLWCIGIVALVLLFFLCIWIKLKRKSSAKISYIKVNVDETFEVDCHQQIDSRLNKW